MKALILADLQWVEHEEWQRFLTIDQEGFDLIFLLGDINQILLETISKVFCQKNIIGVHGDFGFPGDLEYYGMVNCHGEVVQVGEWKVTGVEGANRYKAGDYPMHTQEEIESLCQNLPKVDILLCHNSPCGFHDIEGHPVYRGFSGLNDYLDRCHPRFLFHGHHHVNSVDTYNDTILIGVFGGIIFDFDTHELTTVLHQAMNEK